MFCLSERGQDELEYQFKILSVKLEDVYNVFMTRFDSELLVKLTALSIFREILISLWSLWSFKSVDISVVKK